MFLLRLQRFEVILGRQSFRRLKPARWDGHVFMTSEIARSHHQMVCFGYLHSLFYFLNTRFGGSSIFDTVKIELCEK